MTTGGPRIVTLGEFTRGAEKSCAPADDTRVSPRRSSADLALEELARAELDALDLAGSWREVARAALDLLHAREIEIANLRRQRDDLREEIRRYTSAAVREERRAA